MPRLTLILSLLLASTVTAAPPPVATFFQNHCLECHDAGTQKGGLDLTALKPDFATPESARTWVTIFDRLEAGEMPPKKKPRPAEADLKSAMNYVAAGLTAADHARATAQGRTLMRRLNRVEYDNTIRDLLAVDLDLKEMLPEDGVTNGFDNQDAALSISPVLIERYLEAADAALDVAMVHGDRPVTGKSRHSYLTIPQLEKHIGVQIMKLDEQTAVFTNDSYPPKVLSSFKNQIPGLYRFRICCYEYNNKGKRPLSMLIYSGNYVAKDHHSELVGAFDVPRDGPGVVEMTLRLDSKETIRIAVEGISKQFNKSPAVEFKGPGLAVQWVEVEGPLLEKWPPESHTRLLGDVAPTKGALDDARQIITRFLPRAFRRPTEPAEAAPFIKLVDDHLKSGFAFEPSLRVGLKAILCSPEFLYIKQTPGKLDDYALASRLSYFLWSSMPDGELLAAAGKGALAKPAELRKQVERMLADRKAQAFTENFTGQWLSLRNINATTPDKKLYPEYDDLLGMSMLKETHLFFDELLKHDLSLLNFVDSDFLIIDQRLAEQYDMPTVTGNAFRKIDKPKNSPRGGVLTQAAVLKVTANGTNTSPVTRGVWVLDRLLGIPVPPPPKGTAAIEPDIRGATTIREQLDKHRNVESCAVCHVKIDPPGYALESFDVLGGYRDFYRGIGTGKPGKGHDGKSHGFGFGAKVECDGVLPDGRPFKNVTEFKNLLLSDKDAVAKAIAEKLLIYSTGHGLEFADRAAVKQIVAHAKEKNYGFRTLIHEITQSPVFLNK